MTIKEVLNKEEYNGFTSSQKHSQFLQSWEWGEFQVQSGFLILRLGMYEKKELVFATTLIKKKLLAGKYYYYCPRVGIKNLGEKELSEFFEYVRQIAKKENTIFLRFEPMTKFQFSIFIMPLGRNFQFKKSLDVQPSQTMILDLLKNEEELLSEMHSKTRYNIRLAKKKGVAVKRVGLERFDEFWKLMEVTCHRDGFRLHTRKYYKRMLDIGSGDLKMDLFFAEYEGRVLAANVVSYFGDMATYVHGASSSEYRNLMAPYFLQWEVIKDAKEKGYKAYDFHGVGEGRLKGVTRFKQGFRGEEIKYPGVYDIIFSNSFYLIYKVLRRVRRLF